MIFEEEVLEIITCNREVLLSVTKRGLLKGRMCYHQLLVSRTLNAPLLLFINTHIPVNLMIFVSLLSAQLHPRSHTSNLLVEDFLPERRKKNRYIFVRVVQISLQDVSFSHNNIQ